MTKDKLADLKDTLSSLDQKVRRLEKVQKDIKEYEGLVNSMKLRKTSTMIASADWEHGPSVTLPKEVNQKVIEVLEEHIKNLKETFEKA